MNKSTLINLTRGNLCFPQFSFQVMCDVRHVSKHRTLKLTEKVKDWNSNIREYCVVYWNKDRTPSHVFRVFSQKNHAFKLYRKAKSILIKYIPSET